MTEPREFEFRQSRRDDTARFLRELRELRSHAGLGHAELAARAHYPCDAIRAAEAGPSLPDLPVLSAYVRGCGGTTADWEERWRALTGSPASPVLTVRAAGYSEAANAGARVGAVSAAPEGQDADRVMAALNRVADGMATAGSASSGTNGSVSGPAAKGSVFASSKAHGSVAADLTASAWDRPDSQVREPAAPELSLSDLGEPELSLSDVELPGSAWWESSALDGAVHGVAAPQGQNAKAAQGQGPLAPQGQGALAAQGRGAMTPHAPGGATASTTAAGAGAGKQTSPNGGAASVATGQTGRPERSWPSGASLAALVLVLILVVIVLAIFA